MADFYTVHMEREQRISVFDTKGRKTGEKVERIPISFHDLPLSTAEAYRKKFPDANVRIERQYGMSSKKGGVSTAGGYTYDMGRSAKKGFSFGPKKKTEKKAKTKSPTIMTGDYADVVTRMAGRAS